MICYEVIYPAKSGVHGGFWLFHEKENAIKYGVEHIPATQGRLSDVYMNDEVVTELGYSYNGKEFTHDYINQNEETRHCFCGWVQERKLDFKD